MILKQIDGIEAELIFNRDWSDTFQWITHDDIVLAAVTDEEMETLIALEIEGAHDDLGGVFRPFD